MDVKGIAWPVQYELARGVTLGKWTWGDVSPQKLDLLKSTAAVASPKVHAVMTGRSEGPAEVTASFKMPTSRDQNIWDEYDREQQAILEGQGRGLGLMGDFQNSKNWFGGQIQQIVRLLPDGSVKLERPEMTRSNRFARFLGSRRMLEMKLPKTANFDSDGSVRASLAKKFVLCGRVFVPIDAKDGKVYLMETSEDYERSARENEGDKDRLSFSQFIQWHNALSRNSKQPISKWVTRFDLGFSTSIPVLQFAPANIFFIEDTNAPHDGGKTPTEKVMTDGCGFMNGAALIHIAQHLQLPTRPTAVQGRIAGAKGVWLLHPTDRLSTEPPRIWIRDSQNKIKLPALDALDRAHLIFDLVGP
ncbi:hypothetical protein EVG20_g7977, partial [Dentipellis fragilis]